MWCLSCNTLSDTLLCPACKKKLAALSFAQLYEHRCPTCGTPVLDPLYGCEFCQDALLSYGVYDGVLEHLITGYKHAGHIQSAWLLAELFVPLVARFGCPILIPMPSSRSGRRALRSDHMALVTWILCKKMNLRSIRLLAQQPKGQYTLLSRTQRQQTSNLVFRQKAVRRMDSLVRSQDNAFLILDDIYTTGNTCRRARELIQSTWDIPIGFCMLARA